MKTSVLDASAGVEVVLATEAGKFFATFLHGNRLYVPDLFYSETAGAVRRLSHQKVITLPQAETAFSRLLCLDAIRIGVKPLLARAWDLRHNLTIADAIYVVLAQSLTAHLLTGDTRLARASLQKTSIA